MGLLLTPEQDTPEEHTRFLFTPFCRRVSALLLLFFFFSQRASLPSTVTDSDPSIKKKTWLLHQALHCIALFDVLFPFAILLSDCNKTHMQKAEICEAKNPLCTWSKISTYAK